MPTVRGCSAGLLNFRYPPTSSRRRFGRVLRADTEVCASVASITTCGRSLYRKGVTFDPALARTSVVGLLSSARTELHPGLFVCSSSERAPSLKRSGGHGAGVHREATNGCTQGCRGPRPQFISGPHRTCLMAWKQSPLQEGFTFAKKIRRRTRQ